MAAKKRTKKKATAKTRKARIPKTWAQMARMMDRVGKKFDTIPKSKKRGLSGSPPEHAYSGSEAGRAAERVYASALRFAEQGKCKSAANAFHRAGFEQGVMFAHQSQEGVDLGPGLDRSKQVLHAYEAADKAVRQNCLISTKLSGMRRRKRR